jgi:hypothetical protein
MGKGTSSFFNSAAWFGQSMGWHRWGGHHNPPTSPSSPPAPGSSSGGSGSGGSTGPTTTLTVTFQSEEAGYANAMGWYNARTGEAGILFKNLNDDGWNAGVKAGDTRSLTALQSDVDANNIGFFLIPNGANELSSSLLSSTMKFEVGSNGDGKIVIDRQYGSDLVLGGNDVLFSNQTYNKGDFDYVSGTVGTAGQSKQQKNGSQSDGPDGILGTMAWDDQAMNSCGGTDRDFNDVVFTVTKQGGSQPTNSAPTDITLSGATISENVAGGVIGTLSTADPDAGDKHTYSVSDNRFEVVGGQLQLKSGVSLDHEAGSSVQLTVTTTDQGGLSHSETVTIAVTNVNEGPSAVVDSNAAVNTVSELAAVGTVVGITASSTDPDVGDNVTYSLSNNAGGLFSINSATGVVTVAGGLDYETATQHTITVRATDGSGSFTETDFNIQVGDATQVAVDGYIAGATVFADKNGNGLRDAGEAFTATDAFGRFELNSNGAPLVMVGGYDIAKGLSFQGKLTAQPGSAVVTPLTTLVVELGKAGVANPNAVLASALGMAGVSNFGQIDPIAAAATSITAFARSNQVLNTVTMVANLILGGNPSVGMERALAAAFTVLAAQAADGALDLGDTATLQQLINNTASNLGVPSLDGGLVGAAAAVVAASNDAIDDIAAGGGTTDGLLTQITAASIVAQGDVSAAMKFAGQFADPEGLVESYTGDELADLIESAGGQVANLHGTGTVGTGGNDVITGNGGVHTFVGGDGKDTLSGGSNNDLLYGDAGDDVLNGQDDEDRLTGGAGNDQLNGGLGADIYIHSGTAADGNDVVNTGDDGFDRVVFGTADLDDLSFMRDGNDLVLGASHSGGPAFDGSIRVVNHYAGSSIFFAMIDTGHNVDFGPNPDAARFFFTTELANGLENDDATEVLLGTNGADVINGNGGYRDIILGGGGNDLITGGAGGVDELYGGAGNDAIVAGDGDDLLSGDAGNDFLTGGDGSDTFRFNLSLSGADTLTDFDQTNDVLSFTGVPDTNANGADLNDLLALVSGITNFGAGNDVVVTFSTGASLTFQGAGVSGSLGFTDLVANPATQIRVA